MTREDVQRLHLNTTQMADATAEPCSIHLRHSPHNLTVEFHHVVPVAWQLFSPLGSTDIAPFPGRDPDGRGMLWDSRGVWLCPTGHRNVHTWIVRLMRAAALHQGSVAQAIAAVKTQYRPTSLNREYETALEALTRFLAVDPTWTLTTLTSAGEWGQV